MAWVITRGRSTSLYTLMAILCAWNSESSLTPDHFPTLQSMGLVPPPGSPYTDLVAPNPALLAIQGMWAAGQSTMPALPYGYQAVQQQMA